MKKFLALFVTIVSALGAGTALAQFGMGGGGMGPAYDGAMDKLFGPNRTFSAQMEAQTGDDSNLVSTLGQLSFDNGKSRFEMNISDVKGSLLSPGTAQQMKALGMDVTIFISRPDLNLNYMVYPGANGYIQSPPRDASGSANPDDYKLDTTAEGNETVDGHDCAKARAVVTDKDGNKHEFTVWNASDLRGFPLKITTTDGGRPSTMLFKNVSFAKPDGSLFQPPNGLVKYDTIPSMVQAQFAKKMGPPPGQ